jgi:ABC-type branched-subunit amino acid transport system substrate-binding protein
MLRTQRGVGAVVVGLSVALLAACGGSSDDSGSSSVDTGTSAGASTSSSTSATAPSIMVIGDITSSYNFPVPESVTAVQGALKGTNVKVLTCDSKGDAGSAQACERKAVDAGVVAVINGWSQLAMDQSILAQAGIPVIGNGDSTSADSYSTASSNGSYTAIGIGLAKEGCKKLGIVYLSGSDYLVDNIKAGMESGGGKEVARAGVAPNAPDLTPAIAKLTGAGATCIALSLTPTGVAQAITAIAQSGKKLQMAGVSAVFSDALLKALGSTTDGILVVDNQVSPHDPAAKPVRTDMDKVDTGAPLTQIGIISWVAAKIFAAALPEVKGEVTAASLTTALNGLKNVDMQNVIKPFSATELSNPAYKRFMNPYGINYVIKDGVPVRSGGFYDLAPVLNNG